MLKYSLAILPLNECLTGEVAQVWYANDVCAVGSITQLHKWWECLCQIRPGYGYNVNAQKTCLVTKSSFLSLAESQFSGTEVNTTCEGWSYLGVAINTDRFAKEFIEEKVKGWSAEVLVKLLMVSHTPPIRP